MNRLILAIWLACTAFAGDDSLRETAQFFDKAYTAVLANFARIRERVTEDFQELGRDHGLVADDLIKEATISKPMEGEVLLDEYFKDTLDEAIERVGFNFIRMSTARLSVKACFDAVNESVYTKKCAESQKKLIAKLCGDTDRLHDPEALARYGENSVVCAHKVCGCSRLLEKMALVRGYRAFRRKAVNTFAQTLTDEMYDCLRREKKDDDAWIICTAASYLKDEKVLRNFVEIPPKIEDCAQYTPAERERLERQEKIHRAELRFVILKLLDEYMNPRGYGDQLSGGQALRERALCAANMILDNTWAKVERLFPRSLDPKYMAEVEASKEAAITNVLFCIKKIEEDFLPAMANTTSVHDCLLSAVMYGDSSPQENRRIIKKLSQEKSFKDGIFLLEEGTFKQQITLGELVRFLYRLHESAAYDTANALSESAHNRVEGPLSSEGLMCEVD